ncbi:MAG: nucleoside hydrolase [Clostridia bacterium]|nr:nucleoside hydrolase [Clostridia bacterium]
MTFEQRMKNMSVPEGMIDVVLDTDAYNEIDDQFAIAYLLKNKQKLNTKAIYAAPFLNPRSESPADGMEKSYNEIFKLLDLMNENLPVFKGSEKFMDDENTPVVSDAARDLAQRADGYSPEKPLYVVAIGAITNVASAFLLNPRMAENAVVVWLGGHARHYTNTREFNMYQDVAASRVVMSSGVPFVQLPCMGVVSAFTISKPEIEYWLLNKTPLSDYLGKNSIDAAERYARGTAWTRCIWDVTAIAWLLNDKNKFMSSRIVPTHLSSYDNYYTESPDARPMRYIYDIHRDALMTDLVKKVCE